MAGPPLLAVSYQLSASRSFTGSVSRPRSTGAGRQRSSLVASRRSGKRRTSVESAICPSSRASWRAQAEVDARAERQVLGAARASGRARRGRRTPRGRGWRQPMIIRTPSPGADALAADLDVAFPRRGRCTAPARRSAGAPRPRASRSRFVAQQLELVGVAQQRQQAVRDEVDGRLVPAHE